MSHSEFNSRGSSSLGSSSSEFSDRSSSPPPIVAFDKGSHGGISGQPSGREVGQRFYDLSNSSRSDNKASVSNSVEVAFCCRGIFCCLTVADLERIKEKYQLVDGFSLAVLFGDAHYSQL